MKDGVIADFSVAEGMLRAYISRISLVGASYNCLCSLRCTEAEKRIVRDGCEHAGAKSSSYYRTYGKCNGIG